MAAFWQGYGTLGAGEMAGAVTWSASGRESPSEVEHSQHPMSFSGRRGGQGSNFLAAFAGQGQLPYQVRRRAREQQAEAERQVHLQERVDLLQVQQQDEADEGSVEMHIRT